MPSRCHRETGGHGAKLRALKAQINALLREEGGRMAGLAVD